MCSRCFCPNRARSCRVGERSRCRVGVHANLAASCCMTWWLCSYSISHLYLYSTFNILYTWRMGSPARRSVKCHWSLVEWSCGSIWAQQVTCMCNAYRILLCIQVRVALAKQAILLPYWVTQCHERQSCSEPSNVGPLTLVDLTGFTELFSPLLLRDDSQVAWCWNPETTSQTTWHPKNSHSLDSSHGFWSRNGPWQSHHHPHTLFIEISFLLHHWRSCSETRTSTSVCLAKVRVH